MTFTLGSDVTLKIAQTLEPFVRFEKFKGLNRLQSDFLFIKHTVSIKLSVRRRDQRDKINEIALCWYYQKIGAEYCQKYIAFIRGSLVTLSNE